jgi:SAM-dependent methyltransferase
MDAGEWDRRYAETERFFTGAPNPLVASLVDALPPGRALDLAAGEGRHALWLARLGWHVTAVDFSRVGIDKGRRWAGEEDLAVDWLVEDVYRYQPPSASFDLVLIAYLHPPEPHRELVFGAAAEALVPGGHLLVAGRHLDDLGRDGGRGPGDPALRDTPEQLARSLPAEVEVIRCEAASRTVPSDDGPVPLTDVVAFARRP